MNICEKSGLGTCNETQTILQKGFYLIDRNRLICTVSIAFHKMQAVAALMKFCLVLYLARLVLFCLVGFSVQYMWYDRHFFLLLIFAWIFLVESTINLSHNLSKIAQQQ